MGLLLSLLLHGLDVHCLLPVRYQLLRLHLLRLPPLEQRTELISQLLLVNLIVLFLLHLDRLTPLFSAAVDLISYLFLELLFLVLQVLLGQVLLCELFVSWEFWEMFLLPILQVHSLARLLSLD